MREPNTIQRPELLRRLQLALGLRQAHVAPTMNEGVQSVVIVEDLTTDRSDTFVEAAGTVIEGGSADPGPPTLFAACCLFNPPNSGLRVNLHRFVFSHETVDAVAALKPARIIWYTLDAPASPPGMGGISSRGQFKDTALNPGAARRDNRVIPMSGAVQVTQIPPSGVGMGILKVNPLVPVEITTDPCWLGPGMAFFVLSEEAQAALATTGLYVHWDWEEQSEERMSPAL